MKVSELISKLQGLQKETGDTNVNLYIEEIDDWTKHFSPEINSVEKDDQNEIVLCHLEWTNALRSDKK